MKKSNLNVLKSKEVVVNKFGINVSRFFNSYSGLRNNSELMQKFHIFKPGKKNALIIFCGKDQKNVEYFKKSGTLKELFNRLDQTLIVVNLPKYAYIPELSAAQIEDLCILEGIESLSMLGISYGGYCALELMADIKKNLLPIQIKSFVGIVSPTSFKDMRIPIRLIIKKTRLAGQVLKLKTKKPNLKLFKSAFELTKTFSRTDILMETPILFINTFGFDSFVDNEKSTKRIKNLFTHVEVLQIRGEPFFRKYASSLLSKINIQGAHGLLYEDIPFMRDKLVEFLSQ